MADSLFYRHPMPVQEPEKRVHNFEEVAKGYTPEVAIAEAQRCLNCRNPSCVLGCPIRNPIPSFIHQIAIGDFDGAYQTIRKNSCLSGVCGRICDQENQCEKNCVRGKMPIVENGKVIGHGEPVAIGNLERFVTDLHLQHVKDGGLSDLTPSGHKVAVIGSGPGGLTCADELAKSGHEVTIFESLHTPGGVLSYGIPTFRLPKDVVSRQIDQIRTEGVKIITDMVLGKTFSLEELFTDHGFEAVFLATGAGTPRFMNIPGEDAIGVYSANEFLSRLYLMGAYRDGETPIIHHKRVAVIGGGNVAMDAARSAIRLGAETYCLYRRSEAELPARKEEKLHAEEEGVRFRFLVNPVEIIKDEEGDVRSNPDHGSVKAIRCIKMRLGDEDESGRRRPIPIQGSDFTIPVDCVIMALGTIPSPIISRELRGVDTDSQGRIIVDPEICETSLSHVYAGGDAVSGAATVIHAMSMAKKAARAIDSYLKSK